MPPPKDKTKINDWNQKRFHKKRVANRIRIWFSKLDQRISHKQEISRLRSIQNKGRKRSEEYKQKMSLLMKNSPHAFPKGHGVLYKINGMRGKSHREETKIILRIKNLGNKSRTGMKNSEEHKKRNSIRFTGSGNPFFGKKHSIETIEKMKGRKTSEETRKKIGLASKGRHWIATEEFKQKQRDKWKNRKAGPFKDTKPERMMQIALTLNGIKFEKHKPFKIGRSWHQPDIFIEPNIVIEVDGVRWHIPIDRIKRDLYVTQEFTLMGYHVIRIRDKDILKNTQSCAEKVIQLINELTNGVKLV